MSPVNIFSLVLDGVLALLLAAAVWTGWRLLRNLRTIQESRASLEPAMQELGRQIGQAESALQNIKTAAREEGVELQQKISDGRALSEEIQFLNEAGHALAERLERLATRNREMAEKLNPLPDPYAAEPAHFGESRAPAAHSAPEDRSGSASPQFMIRDPEVERGGSPEIDAEDDEMPESTGDAELMFRTKAERELYEAVKKRQTM